MDHPSGESVATDLRSFCRLLVILLRWSLDEALLQRKKPPPVTTIGERLASVSLESHSKSSE
jgi:hypothetical protein